MKTTEKITTTTAILLTTGISQAGTFALNLWSDDSDLSFIGGTAHTHAADLTPGGTVGTVTSPGTLTHNGVTFDQLNTATGFQPNPTWTGTNYSVGGGSFAFDGSATGNGSSVIGVTSSTLATGITAGGANPVVIQLDGLAQNTDYTFYWFSPLWSQNPGTRDGTLETSFDNFTNIEDTSPSIDQNTTGFDLIISYTYNTGSNTSLYIRTNNTSGDTLHTYGFYNALAVPVPEPSSAVFSCLGGLALILRRKR